MIIYLRFFVFICFGFLLSACRLQNQNPKDLFTSGKLPKKLERFANDRWNFKKHEKELLRLAKRNEKNNFLVVGVPDGGVDVLHPEIYKNINWRTKENGMLRAGFDPLGKTDFANAHLINPELFAFGAEKIVDGKIHNPLANPLELIASIDKQFFELLTSEMANSKFDFSKTHFSKITPETFNIFKAISFMESTSDELIKNHLRDKKEGELYGLNLKVREINRSLRYSENYMMVSFNNVYKKSWKGLRNFPIMMDYIWLFEGADALYDVVADTLEKLEKEIEFSKHFKNYEEFTKMQGKTEKELKDWRLHWELVDPSYKLESALNFKRFGPRRTTPIQNYIDGVRDSVISGKIVTQDGLSLPVNVTDSEVKEHLAKRIKLAEKYLKKHYRNTKDISKRADAEKVFRTLEQSKAALKYIESENISFNEKPSPEQKRLGQLISRKSSFASHPFLSSETKGASHGTHVSGIILNGNRSNVLIEPIRPLTQSMVTTLGESLELAKWFEIEFTKFLNHPVVYAGLRNLMSEYGFSAKGLTKKQAIGELVKLVQPHFYSEAKESAIDFLFIDHLVKSIKKIGESKIALNNVSLGMEYDKKSDKGTDKGPSEEMYEFLKMELFKFIIASSINKYAPHSLFLVAAGNSGNWVDGLSKSALPFDLSSTYFKRYESKGNMMPNHIQKNVVGVMSSGEFSKLSSFTNLAIHSNVPVIVAPGENILSPVNRLDNSYKNSIYGEYVESNFTKMTGGDFSKSETFDLLKEYYGEKVFKRMEKGVSELYITEQEEFWEYERMRIMQGQTGALKLAGSMIRSRHKVQRDRYDGTSMATPMAVQALSRILIKQAKEQGMQLGDIYGREGFRPTEIIKTLESITSPLSKDVYMIPLKFVEGTRKIAPDKAEKELREDISTTLKTKRIKKALSCSKAM